MTRATAERATWLVLAIVGIPPTVSLAMNDPAGVALAGMLVGVLLLLTSPGPASAPNGPRSRASRSEVRH